MSYIDSQIRELREIAEMYEGMDGGELLKECADTIESLYKKLNEKSNGGWIPCSERLPESDGMYLITAKVLQKKEVQYVWFQKNEKIFVCNGIAIAWQPLPEAYHG